MILFGWSWLNIKILYEKQNKRTNKKKKQQQQQQNNSYRVFSDIKIRTLSLKLVLSS